VPQVDLPRAAHPAALEPAGSWLKELRAALLSVFLPGGCRICDHLLTEPTRIPVCNNCLPSFKPIVGKVCSLCGRPVEGGIDNTEDDTQNFVCPICLTEKREAFAFDRVKNWALYEGAMVLAILLLKFENIEPLGALFARFLWEIAVQGGPAFEADVVVPRWHRERERGYNQAALIAKPLAKRLSLPCKSVLLTRIRPRPNKHLLTLEERWESVRGAFATRPGSQVDNLRVLLVDDVMTTGATLDSCARTLRDAGAKTVTALTVARAVSRKIL
jgi:ComF family protein